MTLATEFADFEKAYRAFLIAYTVLTEKKVKAKAPEARKALQEMRELAGAMRKSIQEFKEKI